MIFSVKIKRQDHFHSGKVLNMKQPFVTLKILLASSVALGLSACSAHRTVVNSYSPNVSQDNSLSGINSNYINGSIANMKDVRVPTLGEISNLHKGSDKTITEKEERRDATLRDTGLQYGLQSGLYFAGKYMDERLNQRAAELSNIYNFRALMIHEPHSGQTFMPPVIVQSDHLYEVDDTGEHIKIADKAYTIIQNVTPAPNPPLWSDYLLSSYTLPTKPDENSLPNSKREQEVWKRAVTEGFYKGMQQAKDELRVATRRLSRDYAGMARYFSAYEAGEVRPFVINEQDMGTVGTSKHVRYNEKNFSIVEHASLNFDHPEKQKAIASPRTPTGSIEDNAISLQQMAGVDDPMNMPKTETVPEQGRFFKKNGIDFGAGVPVEAPIDVADPSIGHMGNLP